MNKWQTYLLAAVAATLIYFGGLSGLVVGVAIFLYLAIIMTILPTLRMGEEKSQAIEKRLQPVDELDEESFSFSLADPAPEGWERHEVYPLRNRYKSQYCFGGPPTCNETWEYEIKGSQVFHRLIDANEQNFDEPVFEVINGTVSEDGVAQNTWAEILSAKRPKGTGETFNGTNVGGPSVSKFSQFIFVHNRGKSKTFLAANRRSSRLLLQRWKRNCLHSEQSRRNMVATRISRPPTAPRKT